MCMKLNDYKNEIQQYCIDNKLDYEKIMSAIKGCGNDSITFQVAEKENNSRGLLDETPLPTVLILYKKNNVIKFEQTEYTHQYLSI